MPTSNHITKEQYEKIYWRGVTFGASVAILVCLVTFLLLRHFHIGGL